MSKSVVDKYWICAANLHPDEGEKTLELLRNKSVPNLSQYVHPFNIPHVLRYRSFDELIKMLDELQKQESSCESIIKRIQRQLLEIDPEFDFCVNYKQRHVKPDVYLESFVWDDVRCPPSRNIVENLEGLVHGIQRIEEEVRSQAARYNETKQHTHASQQKEGGNLLQIDLAEIFTKEVLKTCELINTRHLKTIAVVVPKNHERTFLEKYEGLHDSIVPTSAALVKGVTDKDQNRLYILTLMRKDEEDILNKIRKLKSTPRHYVPDEDAFRARKQAKKEMDNKLTKQRDGVARVAGAAYSDIFIALTHMKALRIFVDSVLRYGKPIQFMAFVVKPPSNSKKEMKLWNEIVSVLAPSNKVTKASKDDEYTVFPFVDFAPFMSVM